MRFAFDISQVKGHFDGWEATSWGQSIRSLRPVPDIVTWFVLQSAVAPGRFFGRNMFLLIPVSI